MRDRPSESLKIQDLYEGAYLLCQGFNLKEITISHDGNQKLVTFTIYGEKIQAEAQTYKNGQAFCNVAMLKFTMTRLKDQMFQKIRSVERSRRNECQKNPGRPEASLKY